MTISRHTNQFELDVQRIREDARKHLAGGALTVGNTIDVERLIDVLNQVVATEIALDDAADLVGGTGCRRVR